MAFPAVQLASEYGAELFEEHLSQASSRSTSFDRQFNERITATVNVKNTFIDGFVDDSDEEAEDALPMVATKSCPAVRMLPLQCDSSIAELTAEPAAGSKGMPQGFIVQYLMPSRGLATSAHAASFRRHEPTEEQHDALLAQHEQHPPVPSHPSAGPQAVAYGGVSQGGVVAKAGAVNPGFVVPMAVRQPETSAGSLLHGAGQCKPCAWFWRPQGCENGEECRHCHLCSAGAVKARRKAKLASLRTKDAGERRAPHDSKLMQR